MLPLWIDTDACHDDSLALLLAGALPHFNLLGISTVYGSVSLEYATRNAASLLTALQVPNVPIYPGEEKPSVGKLPKQQLGSGLDGSGLLSLPQIGKQPDHSAVAAMASALENMPNKQVSIACLGPLTNIAALILKHPELVSLIDVISVSTGVDNFNLRADPDATNTVFNLDKIVTPHVPANSTLPLVLLSEPQQNVQLNQEILSKIKRGQNFDKYTVFRQMMFEILSYYMDHITTQVCDPVALLGVLYKVLGMDLGVEILKSQVKVNDPALMWNLVYESIEELEAAEL